MFAANPRLCTACAWPRLVAFADPSYAADVMLRFVIVGVVVSLGSCSSSVAVGPASSPSGPGNSSSSHEAHPDGTEQGGTEFDLSARRAPPIYGYDVRVVGKKTRWRHCPTRDSCDLDWHERPSEQVESIEEAGEARVRAPDGGATELVDVVEIKLRTSGSIHPAGSH